MNESEDIAKLKKKLRSYIEKEIEFNDPHFTQQMQLREGSKEEVINNLSKPNNLVYSYKEKGKYGDVVHCLHFKLSNTRTLRLPIIFDKDNKKGLYIITYIKRYRAWQNMIKKVRK